MKTDCIQISEIFGASVQGEGPNAGARCIFVRVQGCSYSCKWCDSKYTWGQGGTKYTEEELTEYLVNLCKSTNCKRIVLTGGNPCLYNFAYVINQLQAHHIKVDIETQGDIIPEWLTQLDTVVFSPKGPSSGMPDTYDNIVNYIRFNYIRHSHGYTDNSKIAIKIPIFNKDDIEFARRFSKFVNEVTDEWESSTPVYMYLSVGNSDVDTTESIRDRVLEDYEKLLNDINESPEDFENVFILPQIHTLVWGNKQGV